MDGLNAFKANGNIVINAIKTHGIETFDMEIKNLPDDNSVWARIFHHNNRNGTVLWSRDERILYNTEEDRFSRLEFMELYRHPAGHFEFMAIEPDDRSNVICRWIQTNNPVTEAVGTGFKSIAGYMNIYFALARCLRDLDDYNSFIRKDNLVYGNWVGAVGCWRQYTYNNVLGIPGIGGGVTTGSMDLYVRIDNLIDASNVESVKLGKNSLYTKDIIEL